MSFWEKVSIYSLTAIGVLVLLSGVTGYIAEEIYKVERETLLVIMLGPTMTAIVLYLTFLHKPHRYGDG